ncbi:MAG: large subunit ribosomal protein L14 [Microgenomates group bacterium Gr01-1014_16]|nr:MAG: large subunit ribosomal protein L14 [Microgenomates group bacterium Gr01-1014_16]
MLQLRSILIPADNSGAKKLRLINIPGAWKRKFAYTGDVITAVVDQADPIGTVKDSEIVKAVIVRTRKEWGRKDGSYIRFDDNAAVIIDPKTGDPRGTRIFGPVAREVKEKGYNKIASLATEVL